MDDRSLRQLEQTVGRQSQFRAIDAALEQRASALLYLTGEGGIGKTRLLLETLQRARSQPDTLVVGLLDLALAHYQQPITFMGAIAEQVRRARADADLFAAYEQSVTELLAEENAINEARRNHIEEVFLADYLHATAGSLVVVVLDTFEKLHSDVSAEDFFDVRPSSPMEQWLVQLLAELLAQSNTLIVLAGRPRERQARLLSARLGQFLQQIVLGPFTAAESAAYLAAALHSLHLDGEEFTIVSRELHTVAAGRPILLALAGALWAGGLIDLAYLPLRDQDSGPVDADSDRNTRSDQFVHWVMNWLSLEAPEFRSLLLIAGALRRGVRADLLEHIIKQTSLPPTLVAALETFPAYVFVKVTGDDPATRVITLHDEMYELLFEQVSRTPSAQVWYELASAHTEGRMQALPIPERGHDLFSIRRQRQALQIDILSYRLARDAVAGYQYYREISANAIFSGDIDFDNQLQGEIARCFDPATRWGRLAQEQLALGGIAWATVVFQEGVSWVYRRAFTGRPHEALELAERVARFDPATYADDDLLHASLEIARRYILNQFDTSLDEQAIAQYQAIIERLQKVQRAADPQRAHGRAALRQAALQLAIAYDNLGYYHRRFNQLEAATRNYRAALQRHNDLPEPTVERIRAITLNNYGYALMLQGQANLGLQLIEEGLQIFRQEGALLRVAVSMNTRAQILLELGRLADALRSVVPAREQLERGGATAQRYLGLALRAEGAVRRRLAASQWRQTTASNQEYDNAIACYERAMPLLAEVPRTIQALQELGNTYRNWALSRQRRGEAPATVEADFARAFEYYQEALERDQAFSRSAGHDPQRVGLYHDMALAHYLHGDRTATAERLSQARAAIPPAYRIDRYTGLNETNVTSQQQIYWLRLGQVLFLQARLTFQRGAAEAACVELLHAVACVMQYSDEFPLLRTMREFVQADLVALGSVDQIRDLRMWVYNEAIDFKLTERPFAFVDDLFEEVIQRMENR
jgi:tetratricopeptide (TPR) repeat protein